MKKREVNYWNILIALLYAAISILNGNAAYSNTNNTDFNTTTAYQKSLAVPNNDITHFSLIKLQVSDLEQRIVYFNNYPSVTFETTNQTVHDTDFKKVVAQDVYRTYNFQVILLLYPFHYFW